MNATLWAAQAALASLFLTHGVIFIATSASPRRMVEHGPLAPRLLRVIGVAEIVGAIGLIVPDLVGSATILVPLAAAGLVLVMAGAVVFHASRAEVPQAILTLLIAALATFVLYGRGVDLLL